MPVQTPAAGVRLVGVAGVDAPPAGLRRSRGGGTDDATDAVLASALDGAGLNVVADVVVAAPDESAVLLLESEGSVFNWRADRVRYVIPDYLNVKEQLPQATQERDMVGALFGGKVERFDGETQSESVNRFLSKNAADCDLLHFACQDESDFTWLAYTVYGNSFARTG